MSHGKRYQKALENGDEIKIEKNFLIFRIDRENILCVLNDFRDHRVFSSRRSFLTEIIYKLCREKISHFRLRVAENAIDFIAQLTISVACWGVHYGFLNTLNAQLITANHQHS